MTEFDDITEMAARVSQALEAAGIRATLSGGAAVSIYSDNRYQSVDLDFITSVRNEEIAPILDPTFTGMIHRCSIRPSWSQDDTRSTGRK